MLTYHLVVCLLLAIHNQNASAIHVNATGSPHSTTIAAIGDALDSAMLISGWFSLGVIQPTAPTPSAAAQNSHTVLSASEFAKVEVDFGGLRGSGLIELTIPLAAPTVDDRAAATASPQGTATIPSSSGSLSAANQSSITRSDNVTSLAALPTHTSFDSTNFNNATSNNTNFNIPRLSTFAAPALQSSSDGPASRFRASSYRSVAAAASLYLTVLL